MTIKEDIKEEIWAAAYTAANKQDVELAVHTNNIIDLFIGIIDEQLKQVRYDLKHYSDPSEYWLLQGKAYMLKELKNKINEY